MLLKYSNPASQSQKSRSARSIENKTMELMVYVDTITINARGGNVAATNYVLSIMNIVSLHNNYCRAIKKCLFNLYLKCNLCMYLYIPMYMHIHIIIAYRNC